MFFIHVKNGGKRIMLPQNSLSFKTHPLLDIKEFFLDKKPVLTWYKFVLGNLGTIFIANWV